MVNRNKITDFADFPAFAVISRKKFQGQSRAQNGKIGGNIMRCIALQKYIMAILGVCVSICTFFLGCVKSPLQWKCPLGGQIVYSPAIAADGTIYVGCKNNTLYAVSEDGDILWSFTTGGEVFMPAIGPDGTIYVGSADGNLYAINPNGNQKWAANLGGEYKLPVIGNDGTIYVSAGGTGTIFAITQDGAIKWSTRVTNWWSIGHPAIGVDGTIYIGASDVYLAALEPDSGRIKWSFGSGTFGPKGIDAAPTSNYIYVYTSDNRLYELEPDSGHPMRYLSTVVSAPIIGKDGIYVWNSGNKTLYRVPLPSGESVQLFTTSSDNFVPPAIFNSGNLCVISNDSVCLITPSGEIKDYYRTSAKIYSPPTIGTNGIVYLGYADTLMALDFEESYPTDFPWPMYQRDHHHSGRAR